MEEIRKAIRNVLTEIRTAFFHPSSFPIICNVEKQGTYSMANAQKDIAPEMDNTDVIPVGNSNFKVVIMDSFAKKPIRSAIRIASFPDKMI